MKQKKRAQKDLSADLMLPILAVLCILPLTVHLQVYDTGLGAYPWFPAPDGILTDVFALTKSRVFVFLVLSMTILLLLRLCFFRNTLRSMKVFYPLFGYLVFAVVSSLLATNKNAALYGGAESFESIFVLAGYVLLACYTFQTLRRTRDYLLLWKGILLLSIILILLGFLQILEIHPLQWTWLQKLIMSEENFAVYGGREVFVFIGRYVSATLQNPNYAGVFYTMIFSLLLAMTLTEENRRKEIFYLLLLLLTLACVWFTYSRSALLCIGAAMILLFILRPALLPVRKYLSLTGILIGTLGFLFFIDSFQEISLAQRFMEETERLPLQSILTEKDAVHIIFEDQSYLLYLDPETDFETLRIKKEGELSVTEEVLPADFPLEVYINPKLMLPGFTLLVNQQPMDFIFTDEGYAFLTAGGRTDQLVPISHADLHGLESFASARGYIWSRTLPLLPSRILFGSGPDSFLEAFPQNDYVGKALYANRTDRLIEKAHNDFLTRFVQTGGLSVVCLLWFYFSMLKQGKKLKERFRDKQKKPGTADRLLLGAYLACFTYLAGCLVHDSTIQTTPMFYLLAGVLLAPLPSE